MIDELSKKEDVTNVHDPAYSQPLCTVLQIALVDFLRSLNIQPSAVVGHSSGEIAAAYSIGALNRESALKVAFYRGYVSSKHANTCPKSGAMASVNLSEIEVQPYLDQTAALFGCKEISIGCVNSPRNITLSGDARHITGLLSLLEQQKVLAKRLRINVAYHSKAMDAVAVEYQALLKDITMGVPAPNAATMFSSVTGASISTKEVSQSGYWVKNMTSPVRFSEAFSALCLQSSESPSSKNRKGLAVTDVLEIGPHSTLQTPVKDILNSMEGGKTVVYNSLLRRNVSAVVSSFAAVGRLHCLGHPIDTATLNNRDQSVSRAVLPDLPEYPFNRAQSYWSEGRLSKNFRFRRHRRHELLGTTVPDWNVDEARWRQVIRIIDNPWILDHKARYLSIRATFSSLTCVGQRC